MTIDWHSEQCHNGNVRDHSGEKDYGGNLNVYTTRNQYRGQFFQYSPDHYSWTEGFDGERPGGFTPRIQG
jgi:hypothetical protein